MNNLIKKEFIFIYNTNWSEAVLLEYFLKEIKLDPIFSDMPQVCLSENSKGRRLQIRSILRKFETFKEMNMHVQKLFVSFKLNTFRYPAFLALSYALYCSYVKNRGLHNKEICFRSSWEYPSWDNKYLHSEMTSEKYKHERELPLNDIFYWNDSLN